MLFEHQEGTSTETVNGLKFQVTHIFIQDKEKIQSTTFTNHNTINYIARKVSLKIYNQMLAKGFRCVLKVSISEPVSRNFAEKFNDRQKFIADKIAQYGSAAGASVGTFGGPVGSAVGGTAGYTLGDIYYDKAIRLHGGDVLLKIRVGVKGGIGPQESYRMVVIPRKDYDRPISTW